jgi:putative membrane protein
MKPLNVLSWILRIVLFIIILVLVLENRQPTDFNLFGIYHLQLPLIALILIFFVIGILLGLLFGLLRGFASKADVRKLEKEVYSLKNTKTID